MQSRFPQIFIEMWQLVFGSIAVIVLYHYGTKYYRIYKKLQASVNEKLEEPSEAAFKAHLREEEDKLVSRSTLFK